MQRATQETALEFSHRKGTKEQQIQEQTPPLLLHVLFCLSLSSRLRNQSLYCKEVCTTMSKPTAFFHRYQRHQDPLKLALCFHWMRLSPRLTSFPFFCFTIFLQVGVEEECFTSCYMESLVFPYASFSQHSIRV